MLNMSHFDALEAAGHDLTHCGMLWAGVHLYYCEHCGAVTLHANEGLIYHAPKGSPSTQGQCIPISDLRPQQSIHVALKDKLKAAQQADWEKLKAR